MSMSSPQIRQLAWRLLALEAAPGSASDARADVAMRVVEKLRLRLMKLMGADGFRSLLFRASILAKAEVPALDLVQVGPDGSIMGWEDIEQIQGAEITGQAATLLVAYLLELLVTFIGEPLTSRLVRDTWPDASLHGADSSADLQPEEQP